MIKEERRRKRRRRAVTIFILTLLFVFSLIFLLVVTFGTVRKVNVDGNVLYEDEVISRELLNDKFAWNTFYVYFKYNFLKPENIPFIDTVDVRIKNFHTLNVTVYEKGMMGYIYVPKIKKYAYFDKDGIVVETSEYIIADVARIEGLECGDVSLYKNLPVKKAKLKEMLTLTQALKRADIIPDTIIYGKKNSPIAVYGGTSVYIGDTSLLTQKVERMIKILPTIEDKTGILHLDNWTEKTTNIVFDEAK